MEAVLTRSHQLLLRGFEIRQLYGWTVAQRILSPAGILGDALTELPRCMSVEVVRGANGLMTGTGNPLPH